MQKGRVKFASSPACSVESEQLVLLLKFTVLDVYFVDALVYLLEHCVVKRLLHAIVKVVIKMLLVFRLALKHH